jgi:hypothetical protein
MARPEVIEAEAGPPRKGPMKVAPKVIRWHLVHQASNGFSGALATDLVVAEASTD